MPEVYEYLFSYGSLQKERVQLKNFGRKLTSMPDVLPAYREEKLEIEDTSAAAASGEEYYLNAKYTGDPADFIAGTCLQVTREELAQADVYEASANYTRISVQLKSGIQSWVYVSAR